MAKMTEQERKEANVRNMIYDGIQHAQSTGFTETETRRFCEHEIDKVYRGK